MSSTRTLLFPSLKSLQQKYYNKCNNKIKKKKFKPCVTSFIIYRTSEFNAKSLK